MKKSTFLLLLLPFVLLLPSCQDNTQPTEEAAVKTVIERETEMFGALNIEKWSATRTQTENTLTIG